MTPKIESDEDVLTYDAEITMLEAKHKMPEGTIKMVPLIETARGIENCYQAACASTRVVALALGGEDYTANLQCKRTPEGNEIDYARKRIVNAARAAAVEVYDTPNTDAHNDEAVPVQCAQLARENFGNGTNDNITYDIDTDVTKLLGMLDVDGLQPHTMGYFNFIIMTVLDDLNAKK